MFLITLFFGEKEPPLTAVDGLPFFGEEILLEGELIFRKF